MKRLFLFGFLALIFCLSFYLGIRDDSEPNDSTGVILGEDKVMKPQNVVVPQSPAVKIVESAKREVLKDVPMLVQNGVLIREDALVSKVLSSAWIDGEKKAVRRRVRVVEAKFKYPRLRVEEEVRISPKTGKPEVRIARASVADHLMVGLKNGVTHQEAVNILEEQGFTIRGANTESYVLVEIVDFEDVDAQKNAIAELSKLGGAVDFAEPDYLVYASAVPNDPAFGGNLLWGMNNLGGVSGSKADADIDAPEGWEIRHDASGVVVAVTDTGVRYTHEDLAANMWQSANGEYGLDAYDDDMDPMDIDGHGTHCAGTIGAVGDNGLGVAGVAWNVELMALRFLGPNGGTTSDAVRVIDFARENGADVINASWGGNGYSRALYTAIEECYGENIAFVAAAGNDGQDTDAMPHYPSSHDVPNIVSVAATDRSDRLSSFSNYGRINVDITAPGSNIYSCGIGSDTDYQYLNGTSMATPHVAGAIALAKAHFQEDMVEDLINRVYSSADRLDTLTDRVASGGRLNLLRMFLEGSAMLFHDSFDDPWVFKGCYGYWCGDNWKASREIDEDFFSPDTGEKSLWFRWTAPENGLVYFKGRVSKQDVSVVIFEGDDRTALKRLADNFDERPAKLSQLFFYAEKGKTYSVSMDTRFAGHQVYIAELFQRPDNDMVVDAEVIPSGARFTEIDDNCGATAERFEIARPHAGVSKDKSIWWEWNPSVNGDYVITTQGSAFDTVLAVYQGDLADPENFVEVGSNDDRNAIDYTSEVSFTGVAGTNYYIVVDSFLENGNGRVILNGFRKGQLVLIQEPTPRDVHLGETTKFQVVANSSRELSYSWFGPSGRLNGVGNTNELIIDNIQEEDFGDYYVAVSDGENIKQSALATLGQKIDLPFFTYSPKSISVLTGNDTGVYAQVTGTLPITYQWFKDDQPIQGATAQSLDLPNIDLNDAARYYVVATNQGGAARSRSFRVDVSASPWEGWILRHPSQTGRNIQRLRYVGDKFIAVGDKGLLLTSDDGVDWRGATVRLPLDFTDIAYNGQYYVAVGSYSDGGVGRSHSARSLDGVSWELSAPILGNIPKYLASGNGKIVASGGGSFSGTSISADGLAWSNVVTDPDDGSSASWDVIFEENRFVVLGQQFVSISTDGQNWTKHSAPAFSGKIYYLNGKFMTIDSPRKVSFSDDGTIWTAPVSGVNVPFNNYWATVGQDGSEIFYAAGKQIVKSSDGVNWEQIDIDYKPSDSFYNLNAIAFSNGRVTVGGSRVLGSGDNIRSLDIQSPEFEDPPIDRIVNVGDETWALGSMNSGFTTSGIVLQSTDGVEWDGRKHLGTDFRTSSFIKVGMIYYSIENTGNLLLSGSTPYDLRPMVTTGGADMVQITNVGDVIYGRSRHEIWRLNGNHWTSVYSKPTLFFSSIQASEGDLFVVDTDGGIHLSINGGEWKTGSQVGIVDSFFSGGAISVVRAFSKIWIHLGSSSRIFSSSDGNQFTRSNLPEGFTNLTTLPVALVGKAANKAYYSSNGSDWFEFNIPGDVRSFSELDGTLIGLGYQTIYQLGQISNLSPLLTVDGLENAYGFGRNHRYSMTALGTDPENRFDRIEVYLNGALVADGVGAQLDFSLEFDIDGVHHVEIRGLDQDGGVGKIHRVVHVTAPVRKALYGESSANSGISAAQLWGQGFVGIRNNQVVSSRDGVKWSSVSLPTRAEILKLVTDGNIIMAVTRSVGLEPNLWISEDGFQWVLTDYSTSKELSYSDGIFVARSIRKAGSSSVIGVSKDGFSWKFGNPDNDSYSNKTVYELVTDGSAFLVRVGDTVSYSTSVSVWTRLSFPKVSSLTYNDGEFFIISDDHLFNSADGVTWVEDGVLPLGSSELAYRIFHAGGLEYLVSGGNVPMLSHVRANGGVWTEIGEPVIKPFQMIHAKGVWICKSSEGIFVSSDGVNWRVTLKKSDVFTEVFGSFQSDMSMVANDLGILFNVGYDQYFSKNGYVWTKNDLSSSEGDGGAPPYLFSDADVPFYHLSYTGLNVSKDGADWYTYDFPLLSNENVSRSVYNEAEFLVYTKQTSPTVKRFLLRSANGKDWVRTLLTTTLDIKSIIKNSQCLVAIAYDQSAGGDGVYRSVDGVQWTKVSDNASFYYTDTVSLVNDLFTIIKPAEGIVGSRIQKVIQSSDGLTWQTTNLSNTNVNVLAYGNGFYLASENARLLKGASLESLVEVGYPANLEIPRQIIFDGSRFYGRGYSQIVSSSDGMAWSYIEKVVGASLVTVGGKPFELSQFEDKLYQILTDDLGVIDVSGSALIVGVGDSVLVDITMSNYGAAPVSAQRNFKLEGRLSRDSIFGNGDDIILGDVSGHFNSDVSIGSTGTMSLSFPAPDSLEGGDFYVGVHLVEASGSGSDHNNTLVSSTRFVSVPEWELDMVANGNGEIRSNSVAVKYAHKARISLTASAGKGATFAGWGGDAVTRESQITMLMDGDKALQATFVTRVNMQVYIRGGGSVSGVSDTGGYSVGEGVNLTALPLPGWEFSHWGGAASGPSTSTSLVMNETKTVEAYFTQSIAGWKSVHFGGAELLDETISGNEADPDMDGVKNWQEYLHGSDPLNAKKRGVLKSEVDGGYLYIVFDRNVGTTGLFSLKSAASRDLSDWKAVDLQERVMDVRDGVETVEARIPVSNGQRGFIRVEYLKP